MLTAVGASVTVVETVVYSLSMSRGVKEVSAHVCDYGAYDLSY